MDTIDAHIHTWRLNDGRNIWIRDKIAALQRDFLFEDFALATAGRCVSAAIIVQAAMDEDETRSLIEAYRKNPRVAGVIGWLDLAADDIAERTLSFENEDKLCGVRAHPPQHFDIDWLLSSPVQRGLAVMENKKIAVDFLVNCTQLGELGQLLSRLPELKAVLNHGGRPYVMTGDTADWARDIRAIAHNTGCYCKLSGLVERAGVEWDQESLKPWIAILLESFGPERLIFGSNWPVMTLMATPTLWLDKLLGILDDFGIPQNERTKIFRSNAIAAYGIFET